jgi:Tripartite tricarboxylate transporter family receptor
MRTARLLAAVAMAVATLASTGAGAQDWPSRLVRIVVPAAPGGSSDAAARLVTNHFQVVFKQPFIIENKPGNGNALGAAYVAQAEPDGYTLLSSNSASNLTVPLIAKNAGYDPVADFSHIVMLTSSPYVLAVYPGLGVKTLAEFVAKARAQPLSYTAANRGGLGNIGGEYFQRLAGISLQHVPYRGGAPATADVIAGHVPAVFLPVTTLGEYAQRRAGRAGDFVPHPRRRAAERADLRGERLSRPGAVFVVRPVRPEEAVSRHRRPHQPRGARISARTADEEARRKRRLRAPRHGCRGVHAIRGRRGGALGQDRARPRYQGRGVTGRAMRRCFCGRRFDFRGLARSDVGDQNR